jgi:hypothetical protein
MFTELTSDLLQNHSIQLLVLECGYASGRESAEPSFVEMGEMGKGSFQVYLASLVAGEIS